MTGNPASVSVLALTRRLACLGLLAMTWPVQAQQPNLAADAQSGQFEFDIPAQPLASALQSYARMTGQSVFFDGELAAGRQSEAVHGTFAPHEVLQLLLRGTNLAARHISATAFTLTAMSPVAPVSAQAQPEADALAPSRDARTVQASLERALCQSPQTRPGTYRAVVQLWLSPMGDVVRSRLVGSTGQTRRDGAIETAVKALKFSPSPSGEPEPPMTILLLPKTATTTDVCAAAAS